MLGPLAMSHLERVQSIVTQVARRRHFHRAWAGFWKGLLAGALIWSATLLVYKLFPVPLEVLIAGAAAAILAPLIGLLLASLKRPSLVETARWVDGQTQLADRLTTALELSATGPA